MLVIIQKIWRLLRHPQKIQSLLRKALYTLRVSGLRGLWFAGLRYIQKQQFDIQTTTFIRQQIDTTLSALLPVEDGMIFISHDASATGAPITLLNQCRAYRQVFGQDLVIVLLSSGELGELIEEFRGIAPVIDLHRNLKDIVVDENIKYAFSKLRELGYSRCIANTVVSGALQQTLADYQIQTIYEIHELLGVIRNSGWDSYAQNIAQSGSIVVFPAHYVADKFIQHFGLPVEHAQILPQGISLVYENGKSSAREKFLARLKLPFLPTIKLILGAGLAHHRKGTDLFFEVALEFYRKQRTDVHFVWLGNRDEYFEHWKNQILPELPYKNNLHFLDFDPQPAYIFAGADVFLLTSREDPFPSVALEALANDTPVITFRDTGGIEEILDGTNGVVVDHLNVPMMANAAWEILQNPNKMRPSATKLQTYPEFIRSLVALFRNYGN